MCIYTRDSNIDTCTGDFISCAPTDYNKLHKIQIWIDVLETSLVVHIYYTSWLQERLTASVKEEEGEIQVDHEEVHLDYELHRGCCVLLFHLVYRTASISHLLNKIFLANIYRNS